MTPALLHPITDISVSYYILPISGLKCSLLFSLKAQEDWEELYFTLPQHHQQRYVEFGVALLLEVGTARICLRNLQVSGCVCRLGLIKVMK